jgi:hypothetical protein
MNWNGNPILRESMFRVGGGKKVHVVDAVHESAGVVFFMCGIACKADLIDDRRIVLLAKCKTCQSVLDKEKQPADSC